MQVRWHRKGVTYFLFALYPVSGLYIKLTLLVFDVTVLAYFLHGKAQI
jgi:hypothetical protein